MKEMGVYIHIPFCVRRCPYCGFFSKAVGEDPTPETLRVKKNYVGRQIRKIERYGLTYGDRYEVDTIYIGGGTPSILPAEETAGLIDAVRRAFPTKPDAEISLEANPGTLTPEKLSAFREAGVNRLSFGAQSFSPRVLATLERIHTPGQIRQAFRDAREAGFDNINLDLMFGIPGQTMAEWEQSLTEALTLGPEHISFYSLQLEEGTRFYEMYRKDALPKIDAALDREMYHYAIARLRGAGYEHYEISNAAKPGFACRHNLKYWTFEPYLGVGSSASSFLDGARFTEAPHDEYHLDDFMDDAVEYVITGLRLTRGISRKAFSERFGRGFWDVFPDARETLGPYFQQGLLLEEGDILRLSEMGIDVSNDILAEFTVPGD